MSILQASARSWLKPRVGMGTDLFVFISREFDF